MCFVGKHYHLLEIGIGISLLKHANNKLLAYIMCSPVVSDPEQSAPCTHAILIAFAVSWTLCSSEPGADVQLAIVI